MRYPQDSNRLARDKRNQGSEFGWGEGLVPPGKERATPADGGMYRGTAPDMSEPRRKRRREDPPPGNPGVRIG